MIEPLMTSGDIEKSKATSFGTSYHFSDEDSKKAKSGPI